MNAVAWLRPLAVLPRLLCTLALAAALSACERLLVEPATPAPARTSLSISFGSSAGRATAVDADAIRIQVTRGEIVLLDTLLSVQPGQQEVLVPVLFSDAERTDATVRVELRQGFRPVFRGRTDVELRQRRVTDAVITFAPASMVPLAPTADLSAGIYHSCAVSGSSQIFCWGINEHGQLGHSSLRISPLPLAAGGAGAPFRSVGAGYVSSCGLASDGRVLCWGANERGALGNNSGGSTGSPTPVPVNTPLRFQALSVGGLHACGLAGDGSAHCWGFNGFGQLGTGSTADSPSPTAVAGGLRFRAISAGYLHTCAITAADQLHCWGLNDAGQLGDGTTQDRSTPTRVAGGLSFLSVSAGGLHTCALGGNQQAFCWGRNQFGQLGTGSTENRSTPATIGGTSFVQISAGGLHTCAVAADGRALCWGYNRSGAVGDGSQASRPAPTPVAGTQRFRAVAAGLHHSCGILSDGRATCWGYNQFGQLGDGTVQNQLRPTEVLGVAGAFLLEGKLSSPELASAVAGLVRGVVTP